MARLKLSGVKKSYGAVDVLHGIDLDIPDGDFTVFVGPSGCGKSTLLRTIAGLEKATGGEIRIGERRVNELPAADRGLAMVFQSYALYPHMTVRQNLAFGLENQRMKRAEIEARIAEAARMLEIAPYLDRRPGQLSGGQRQRVAIGRAIVRNPQAFLLDEPLSNLDAELRVSMRAELSALHARLRTTMIYVTHDQVEAMTLADRIVVLRAGRIEQVGSPLDLYNRPANRFVAGFIGAPNMNFLPGTVSRAEDGRAEVELLGAYTHALPETIGGVDAGREVTLGLRPQHLRLADGDVSGFPVKTTLVEALGAETVLHGEAPGGAPIIAVLPGQRRISLGEIVRLDFSMDDLHAFGADGLRLGGH